jgi:predicted HTH transcriptional regulator
MRDHGSPNGVGDEALGDAALEAESAGALTMPAGILSPTGSFDIAVLELDGKTVFVIRVEPYPVPPLVRVNEVAWVRSASTTVKATDADETRLRERRPEGHEPFDCRRVRDATIETLDVSRLAARHAAAREDDADPETFPELPAWLV